MAKVRLVGGPADGRVIDDAPFVAFDVPVMLDESYEDVISARFHFYADGYLEMIAPDGHVMPRFQSHRYVRDGDALVYMGVHERGGNGG